ncbi:TPA: hypothetical protein N2G33_004410 [Salmonella enterica]|nr:hypothetical protein [Salmonella enterica]
MKLLTIILLMVLGLGNAQTRAQQNTSVVITASLKDISGCLSDYLGKSGYSLGNITHFAGIGDELPVFSHQYNRIIGEVWINSALFGEQEKVVGIYNVTDESLPCLLKILQNCKETLTFRDKMQ